MASIQSVLSKLSNSLNGPLQFPSGYFESGDSKYISFSINERNKILSPATFSGFGAVAATKLGSAVDTIAGGDLADVVGGVVDASKAIAQFAHDATGAILDKTFSAQPISHPTGKVIYLPIPANLVDQYDYQFNTDQLGTVGGFLATHARAGVGIKDALKEAGLAVAAVGSYNVLNAAGSFTSATSDAIGRTAMGALNPYARNNFSGVGFKTHQFRFNLIARNRRDSDAIKGIIAAFRTAAAPVGVNEPIFDVKNTFTIQFSNSVAAYLYQIQECYLQSIQVSYNTMGQSAFHDGGAPIDVELQLVFTELSVYSQEADDALYGGEGVDEAQAQFNSATG